MDSQLASCLGRALRPRRRGRANRRTTLFIRTPVRCRTAQHRTFIDIILYGVGPCLRSAPSSSSYVKSPHHFLMRSEATVVFTNGIDFAAESTLHPLRYGCYIGHGKTQESSTPSDSAFWIMKDLERLETTSEYAQFRMGGTQTSWKGSS